MSDPCNLIHSHCGACGMAIHEDGGCGCHDNRHHPIADIHRDIRSAQQSELERLRPALEYIASVQVDPKGERGLPLFQALVACKEAAREALLTPV